MSLLLAGPCAGPVPTFTRAAGVSVRGLGEVRLAGRGPPCSPNASRPAITLCTKGGFLPCCINYTTRLPAANRLFRGSAPLIAAMLYESYNRVAGCQSASRR